MRILVVGGTRFIGLAAVRQLAAQGHEIALFHRGESEPELPDSILHMHGNRADIAEFRDELARFAPDVVVDMYALKERDARGLVDAVRGIAPRVVVLSSMDTYRAYGRLIGLEPGPLEPLPLTEAAPVRERLYPYRGEEPRAADDPQKWVDEYDKILVERVVMDDATLAGTVLRLPMVYGPDDYQHRFLPYLKRMDDGRRVIVLDDGMAAWRSTWGYVDNVAAAIALATTDERAAGRVYNVAEDDASPPMREWVRLIGQAAGWDGEIIAVPKERMPESLLSKLDTAQHLVADATRIRAELGYRPPVPRDEAFRRTVAWERANVPAQLDPAMFDYASEDALLAELGRP